MHPSSNLSFGSLEVSTVENITVTVFNRFFHRKQRKIILKILSEKLKMLKKISYSVAVWTIQAMMSMTDLFSRNFHTYAHLVHMNCMTLMVAPVPMVRKQWRFLRFLRF